jgi:dTDP-4-amino-4,6-dideoxygalactose transaminase
MQQNKKDLAIFGGEPTRKTMLPFGRPDIRDEEIEAVVQVLKSRWIGTGPKVPQFEEEMKKYLGSDFVLATNSASSALHLALIGAGVNAGDEVITSPITFPSTVNMIENVGAKPIFVDIDPETGLLDVELIEAAITKKTKAILPVHLFGQPCDMDKIWSIAKKHNLLVIEDAAEALGAEYQNKKIGNRGDFIAFSFAINKVITSAEGGVLVVNTKDDKIADRLRMYTLHGMNRDALKKYPYKGFTEHFIEVPGFKYNMTDIHATIGSVHLARIKELLNRRDEICKIYDEGLKGLPMKTPKPLNKGERHGRCFYVIRLIKDKLNENRNNIQEALKAENIGSAVHFFPMHLQPYYAKKYGYKKGDLKNAEEFAECVLSLPLATDLTNQEIEDVIKAIKKVTFYYTKS